MGQTPASGSSPYLSVDEFLGFKDMRAIGMLANDAGVQNTQSQLETNTRIAMILGAASGQVESALFVSERYSSTDLATFNGNSQQFLKLLVANIAFYNCFGARGAVPPESVVNDYKNALDVLKQLGEGEITLAFQESMDAGIAENSFLNLGDFIKLGRFTDSCERVLGVDNDRRRSF